MERRFFDWRRPFLRETVNVVLDENVFGGKLDLSKQIFVFSASRALRQFENLLAAETEKRIAKGIIDADWVPPETITIGALPELFYVPRKPFANRCAELFAWRGALREVAEKNPGGMKALFPSFPENGDFSKEVELAEMVARLHFDLASEGLNFSAPTKTISIPLEVQRWQVLYEIEQAYLNILDRTGLCDRQTERKNAVTSKRFAADRLIRLVGIVDMDQIQKEILDQISDNVTAYISAPKETPEDLFDPYGCILPDAWESRDIPIPEEVLIQLPTPVKEGETAALYVRHFGMNSAESFDPSLVSVTVPDPETIPFLKESLADLGLTGIFGGGTPASENRVFLLLRATGDYLHTKLFEDFATWVRHPDVERALVRLDPELEKTDWLSRLDNYQRNYIPQILRLPRETETQSTETGTLSRLFAAAARLLAPLREKDRSDDAASSNDPAAADLKIDFSPFFDSVSGNSAPISAYPAILSEFLLQFYPDGEAEETEPEIDRQVDEALKILYRTFDEASALPPELCMTLFCDQAITFFLNRTSASQIPPAPQETSVPLLGWLDSFCDEAPNLIITGLNNGIVPENIAGDVFLPNTARQQLVIKDNQRRYVRDAYFLSAILASRNVRILFARRSLNEDPLLPSRLLLTGEPAQIARRILRLFDSSAESTFPAELSPPSAAPKSDESRNSAAVFMPPILQMTEPLPETMSVTDFADFLNSPYVYFLRKALKLETITDGNLELDFGMFGSIVHNVLNDFGKSDVRESTDEKEIADYLSKQLDLKLAELKRRNPAGTVILQGEMMRSRLKGFARWQADWRKAGSRIVWTEISPSSPVYLKGDFTPTRLKGRIDRIDYNEKLDRWFVFDYKTYDSGSGDSTGKTAWDGILSPLKTDDGTPLINTGVSNLANFNHRKKNKGVFLPIEYEEQSDQRWTNLQLPLYAVIAGQILKENGKDPHEKLIALAYINLQKDGKTTAYLGNWDEPDLNEAYLTACWVRKTIERLWKSEINPNDPIEPDLPELGKILDQTKIKDIYELRGNFV